MTNNPETGENSDDIRALIRVSPDEFDLLFSFLKSKGIRAAANWGMQNSMHLPKPEDIAKLMKSPAPYLLIYGMAQAVSAAFNAYAETHKRSLKIIKNAKGGIKLEATNITPEELEKLDMFDVLEFDRKDKN